MKKITVRDFESKVRQIEEVTIVVRAAGNELVDDYDYERCASSGTSITDWVETRIKPRVGEFEFDIISPDYVPSTPHGRTKLGTLRDQYER